MAKSSLPVPTGGSVLPKLLSTLVGVAVLMLVVKHPADAAEWLTQGASSVGSLVDGLATFLQHIIG